ncbi:lipid II flippase MurJ [Oleiphilus sp. HI0081]|nr:lipid II flippase MurJ [Oleiphilus sp. HI0043]KZY49988.1 lipid II flippase MurJ [Oleiphilus sp. HI0050]KZY66863.1 lipid II flippase MurJ [Oleiphilus sp. HI0061]KZY75637.1 lipid II flippase MurJ [Oleiphilus sp. HI0069]KZY84146.1 lipid II flippase MurJ [Oleiphilus sp. HI0068]KZY95078.1 lipid II flippase MurJ [Oleiphilus sp. HI0072]KZZ11850.1 lipid II flippase MurJ [Oleiphilus sp. HI0078]KZZ23062.1 lipid II flippase MurJ [Oleiphilus sp. HI0081]KZZ31289.1 lipid II flippase MurJ [Oleiphilus s
MTMLSRVFGLVRDVVVANLFGASAGADAFFVAFKIPNFFRRLFAEGAFSQAFVPVLSEYRSQRTEREVRQLVNSVAGVLGLVLLLITALAVMGAPWLTALFAPGFLEDTEKYNLASDMLRITFPYLLLISLTAFAGSILNSYGYFAIPAFTPVLLNLVLISAALWLTPLFTEPVMGLAWGVFIAGLIQLFFQFPFLIKMGLMPRPRLDYRHEGVRRIFILMVPALFGVSVSQINLLLDTVLASFLQTGSVSWLYYSDRLAELPLGIFGIAIATVILPSLSRKHSSQSHKAFSDTLDWAIRIVLLMGVPAAVALIVLAEPLVTSLFYYGALEQRDVYMSAMSLRAYALGLLAFMLIKVLAPGYFSRQDMKTPVKIGIWAMCANMVFNLILIWPLQHTGLALATALSSWMNALWLLSGLVKRDVYHRSEGWALFVLRIVVAVVAMVLAVSWMNVETEIWFDMSVWERITKLLALVVVGIVSYFIVLLLSGMKLRALVKGLGD